MELTLGGIIGIAILLFIVKKASKWVVKIIAFLAVLAVGVYMLYHFGLAGFDKNPLELPNMQAKYCKDKNDPKCACIVEIIELDLSRRFSKEELFELKEDRMQLAYAFAKSYEAKRREIKSCLKERNAEHALIEFQNDLLPIENDLLDKVRGFFDVAKEKASEKMQDFLDNKNEIDEKY